MNNETLAVTLPVLPIKRTVLFPGIMMPLTIGRVRSIAAVEAATKTEDKMILVVAQRDPLTEEPGLEDLYTIGTKAIVKQIGRSEEGAIHALIQGLERVALLRVEQAEPFLLVQARRLDHPADQSTEVEALHRAIQELVTDLPRLVQAPGIQEAAVAFSNEDNPVALAYRVASLLNLTSQEEQKLLESSSTIELLRSLYGALSKEIQILQLRDKITSDAQAKIGKTQREYVLREQLKTIQQELGEGDGEESEIDHLKKRGEGTHRRTSRGFETQPDSQGADSLLGRPSGRRQDQSWAIDREGHGTNVRALQPRRCAR
jgi:ATP-dependent Lon protease